MFFGRFIAKLSNGQVVVEIYPEEKPRNVFEMGWHDLQTYCEKHDLRIVEMMMRFRNFTHATMKNAESYCVNMRTMNTLNIANECHRGLGFTKDGKQFIVWFDSNGIIVDMEVR